MTETHTNPFPWDEEAAPEAIRALPRDSRGLPIPWSVTIGTDGKPDFRVLDQEKVFKALKEDRCQLCGGHLGYWQALVGGPGSMKSRMFTDPAMHPDCARFALQVCPFLAAPKFAYARHVGAPAGHKAHVNIQVSTERPEIFYMGLTRGTHLGRYRGETVIVALPWKEVEQWRHGKKVS